MIERSAQQNASGSSKIDLSFGELLNKIYCNDGDAQTLLPTDEEARYAILEALHEEKRSSQGGLSFDQLHDKLYIPWPILWFNLDYLEDEKLILHNKPEIEPSGNGSALPSIYELSMKGQMVIEYTDEYTEKYPFLAILDANGDK